MNLTVKKIWLPIFAFWCVNFSCCIERSAAAETMQPQLVHENINKALIAGQPTTSATAAAADEVSAEIATASGGEILAVDNLLQLATTTASTEAVMVNIAETASAANPVVDIATGGKILPVVPPDPATASQTPKSKTAQTESDFVDTLYPDPLSPAFPTSSGFSDAERNRPALDIIEEINRKAEEIAEKTAAELGIDYIPPHARISVEKIASSTETSEAAVATPGKDDSDDSWSAPLEPENDNIEHTAAAGPDESATEDTSEDSAEEVIPVQWPDSELDPEFASGTPQAPASGEPTKATEAARLYEKSAALEPALLVKGNPVDEQCDLNQIKKLTGRIIPEIKRLARRSNLYRWAIETDDGRRFPLKSNLKLLTEVRNEKLLDGRVHLSGQFAISGANDDTPHFIVESITVANPEKEVAEGKPAAEDAPTSR